MLPAPVIARTPLLDGLGAATLPALGGGATWVVAATVVRIAAGAVTRERRAAGCRTACLVAW